MSNDWDASEVRTSYLSASAVCERSDPRFLHRWYLWFPGLCLREHSYVYASLSPGPRIYCRGYEKKPEGGSRWRGIGCKHRRKRSGGTEEEPRRGSCRGSVRQASRRREAVGVAEATRLHSSRVRRLTRALGRASTRKRLNARAPSPRFSAPGESDRGAGCRSRFEGAHRSARGREGGQWRGHVGEPRGKTARSNFRTVALIKKYGRIHRQLVWIFYW